MVFIAKTILATVVVVLVFWLLLTIVIFRRHSKLTIAVFARTVSNDPVVRKIYRYSQFGATKRNHGYSVCYNKNTCVQIRKKNPLGLLGGRGKGGRDEATPSDFGYSTSWVMDTSTVLLTRKEGVRTPGNITVI